MTEQEIIVALRKIDDMLAQHKKIIDAYSRSEVPADSSVGRIVELTKILLVEQLRLKTRLLDVYGIIWL